MNPFQKRAEQAAKILSCYSNIAECIPQPITKAEERKPLVKVRIARKVSRDELLKAEQNVGEALASVKGSNPPGKTKRELAKEIVCKAFDDNIIDAETFLDKIKNLDK